MATYTFTLGIPADMVPLKTFSWGKMKYGDFMEKYGFMPNVQAALNSFYQNAGYYPQDSDTIKYNEPTILNLYRERYVDQMRSAGAAASKSSGISSVVTTINRETEKIYKEIADASAAKAAAQAASKAALEATQAAEDEKTARAIAAAEAAKDSPTPVKDAAAIINADPESVTKIVEAAQQSATNAESQNRSNGQMKNYLILGGLGLAALMLVTRSK